MQIKYKKVLSAARAFPRGVATCFDLAQIFMPDALPDVTLPFIQGSAQGIH